MKLEIGEHPTAFHSRPYAEELILCKRFYQDLRIDCICFCNNKKAIYPSVSLQTPVRVKPTITTNEMIYVKAGSMMRNGKNLVCFKLFNNALLMYLTIIDLTIQEGMICFVTSEQIFVDAEIY